MVYRKAVADSPVEAWLATTFGLPLDYPFELPPRERKINYEALGLITKNNISDPLVNAGGAYGVLLQHSLPLDLP